MNFACGQPGNIAGLDHMFYHTFITSIPYLQYVEIPVSFAETGLCSVYKNVALQITATCERSATVYQYGVEYNPATGDMNVNYNERRTAENSTATIDTISWSSITSASSSSISSFDNSYYSDYEGSLSGDPSLGNNKGIKAIHSSRVEPVRSSV